MQVTRQQGWLVKFLAMGMMTVAVSMAGLAQAANSNGPYYAPPSWDQKLPVEMRFIVLTDWNSEAVLDRETGLVWEKITSRAFRSWNAAREACVNLRKGNRLGWRLPSVYELASVVDASGTGSALPAGHPFAVTTKSKYWSVTTDAVNQVQARVVEFALGSLQVADKTENNLFWCVRGGNNADQY